MSGQPYKGTAEVLTTDGQLVTKAGISLEVGPEGEYRVTAFSPHQRAALGKGGEFLLRVPGREDLLVTVTPAGRVPALAEWLDVEVRGTAG